jgi:hypothetical protein
MGHGQGRSYDLISTLFFFGRRRRVFSRLAALSGACPATRCSMLDAAPVT